MVELENIIPNKMELSDDSLMLSLASPKYLCNNESNSESPPNIENKINCTDSIACKVTSSGKHPPNGGKNPLNGLKNTSSLEDKLKLEPPDLDVSELLGSVTIQNCPGVRTSARVIQKMKQDSIRPSTPPLLDREHKSKDEKILTKTPSQVRANKPNWTNVERNYFFDAINEFGKDFESIGNFINTKMKRKNSNDPSFKTKDHVRQQYYQAYHKICKYVKFSDEIKKVAQELYALINYGEMRRKLQFLIDKHFMKLKHLIYNGHITIRCKGKNIRIKTPSCKALRKLNQLDDTLEDIRLPSKIEVVVTPANMESFYKVQALAQNPKARTTVPLQKRLINFINSFQYKWREREIRLAEEESKIASNLHSETSQSSLDSQQQQQQQPTSFQNSEICFRPKPGIAIHRPLLSITKYLSSYNLCLSAYEERFGIQVRGETLSFNRITNKRQRSDSGSEMKKSSPEMKKMKNISTDKIIMTNSNCRDDLIFLKVENNTGMCENKVKSDNENDSLSNDQLSSEISELLCDDTSNILMTNIRQTKMNFIVSESTNDEIDNNQPQVMTTDLSVTNVSSQEKAIISNSVTIPQSSKGKKTNDRRRGGGEQTAKNVTSSLPLKPLITDDVIKEIRKGWTISNAADIMIGDLYVVFGHDSKLDLEYYWMKNRISATSNILENTLTFIQKQNGISYNTNCDNIELMKTLGASKLENKLKHLLLIANLNEQIRKRQCLCGHRCEKGFKSRVDRELGAKSYVSHKTFPTNNETMNLFRQPATPFRKPAYCLDSGVVTQLQKVSRMKMSRQVVVQRSLLPGGTTQKYDVVEMKNLQNNLVEMKECGRSMPEIDDDVPENNVASSSSLPTTSILSKADIDLRTETNPTSSIDEDSSCERNESFSTLNVVSDQPLPCDDDISTRETFSQTSTPSSMSLPESAIPECSNSSIISGISSSINPITFFRDSSSNSRWLEENVNDYSLTSLLGHLDEISGNRDITNPSSNLSVISENSVDYMTKFAEITASMQNEERDY